MSDIGPALVGPAFILGGLIIMAASFVSAALKEVAAAIRAWGEQVDRHD
jgi:hypothetical protein